jgi:hypothetical protein
MAQKKKTKRKRAAKRSNPKKRSTRKVGVHKPLVSDEALERSYSF